MLRTQFIVHNDALRMLFIVPFCYLIDCRSSHHLIGLKISKLEYCQRLSEFIFFIIFSFHFVYCILTNIIQASNIFFQVFMNFYPFGRYIFSSRTTILWDVSFNNVIIKIPWRNNNSELYIMVIPFAHIALIFM